MGVAGVGTLQLILGIRMTTTDFGLTIIADCGQALMPHANLPKNIHYKVWREPFHKEMLLDGLVPMFLDKVKETWYVHWCVWHPDLLQFL